MLVLVPPVAEDELELLPEFLTDPPAPPVAVATLLFRFELVDVLLELELDFEELELLFVFVMIVPVGGFVPGGSHSYNCPSVPSPPVPRNNWPLPSP